MSAEPSSGGTGVKYWAFLSYSHQDNLETRKDGQRCRIRWAEWLHDTLENYGVPAEFRDRVTATGEPMPDRFFPVFQDEKELPINADLAESIRRALERVALPDRDLLATRSYLALCQRRGALL